MATLPEFSNSHLADPADWDIDSIFEALPVPTARLALDGAIRLWNRAAERLLGYAPNTVIGVPGSHLVAEEEGMLEWSASFAEVRSSGVPQNFRIHALQQDGSLLPLAVSFVPIKNGRGILRGIVCSMNVVEATKQEISALDWQNQFEVAIQASGLILREWRLESDELKCTGDVQGLLGIRADGINGGIEQWVECIHPDDREVFMREFESVLSQNSHFDLEYRLRHSDGSYKAVRDRGHLVVDVDGRIVRVTALVMDISEKRALEDRLRHSQKMEAFGRLAGGVAHDFNNLLTVISGYTEMMKEEFSANDPRRNFIVEVEKAANRAASLTGQLLAFSRQQVLKLRVLNLNDVLADVGKMLRRLIGEHLKLLIQPGNNLGRVRADLGQLEQVLINLAVNARDAMPNGGTLQISSSNVVVTKNEPKVRNDIPEGDYVLLSVSDTGCGMTDEIRAQIFEPFFTTKAPGQGTGLGLATCYGIVRQFDGYITVDSQPNAGTVFGIYLPRVYEAEMKPGRINTAQPPQGGSEIILLVEDDATVRKLSAAVLTRLGYEVVEAEDGEEALELATARGLRHVDLLITDMVMPKMGGLDLAAKISVRFPESRILFTSGYPTHCIDPTIYQNKISYLQKPFIPKTLAAQVRALLDS